MDIFPHHTTEIALTLTEPSHRSNGDETHRGGNPHFRQPFAGHSSNAYENLPVLGMAARDLSRRASSVCPPSNINAPFEKYRFL
ncbi:MAG: hypothetical protein ACO329_10795 [Steroidobacteraceae bacterium]